MQAWELGLLERVRERHCHPRKLTKVRLTLLLRKIALFVASFLAPRKRPVATREDMKWFPPLVVGITPQSGISTRCAGVYSRWVRPARVGRELPPALRMKQVQGAATGLIAPCFRAAYLATLVASLTHFFVKLDLAAPESFLSAACAL